METGHVESGSTLSQRSEADKVMHPSCLEPTVEASEGSVVIWGGFSWSAQG